MRIFVTALVMLIGLCGSGVALRAEQRGAGECNVLRVLQTGTHVFSEVFVLGAMRLIDDDNNIATR